jgi:hypothetical protein
MMDCTARAAAGAPGIPSVVPTRAATPATFPTARPRVEKMPPRLLRYDWAYGTVVPSVEDAARDGVESFGRRLFPGSLFPVGAFHEPTDLPLYPVPEVEVIGL